MEISQDIWLNFKGNPDQRKDETLVEFYIESLMEICWYLDMNCDGAYSMELTDAGIIFLSLCVS